MFAEAIEAILARHCTPAAVRAIESGANAQPLAKEIADSGFHDLLAPEVQGGAGAGWRDFYDVVTLCGAYAVPLPLAQTLAARAIVADAASLPAGLLTFAPVLVRDADGALHAHHVPAARLAAQVLAAEGDDLLLLPVADAQLVPSGIHASQTMTLRWRSGSGRRLVGTVGAEHFQALAALVHAGLLAGAMKRAFDMTMGYANDRVQFGKSIGKFQAVQHQLAVMAEHVAAARMSAEAGFADPGKQPSVSACAVAKARTSEAAQLVASIAHALHGAIGVTEEYDLQLFTRRLHEWRVAHGSEVYWHRVLGWMFVQSTEPLAVDFIRTLS